MMDCRSPRLPFWAWALPLALSINGPELAAATAPPLTIISASYLGTGGEDDLEGAAGAPDGTIYVVGNTRLAGAALPGGVLATHIGTGDPMPACGCGFVAHLSADGKKLMHVAEFATGVVQLTTVQVNARGIYIGGYASAALEPVLDGRPGLLRRYPLTKDLQQFADDTAAGKKDPIAGRPGLGRRGSPCILRLSADLTAVEAGTYLEGWQQVWDKVRVAKLGQVMHGDFHEFFWQPTGIALLPSGDVAVCHDGGYFRALTDADRDLAKGDQKFLDRLAFYDTCDWLSRLTPDLSQRLWKQPIITPSTDAETAKRIKNGWPYPHYGNPRTTRMRADPHGDLYLCGWSASATSQEPWWSPYLWKVSAVDGTALWKAYDYDPMSGGGNRMGGTVSDTAVTSLALDQDGNLLTTLLADGGNTVMGLSPTADWSPFEAPINGVKFGVKLVHWWGQVHRFDAATRHGLGGARIGPWGFGTDVVPLPDRNVLMVGRYNNALDFTADAWWTDRSDANPNAFLRVYSPDFVLRFSTTIPDVVPFEIARLGERRSILVGRAEHGLAPTQDGLSAKPSATGSGYFMIMDWTP
jgi:hypothetical protein